MMKNSLKISAILASMFLALSANSQSDSLGMPGDDLDLRAVLSIFKQSSSIEDFEKRLNSADTKVNNLDLNNDNQVDYLRVIDYGKDDFHSIVIQDPVSKSESQDIAVISVVKKGDNTAHVQIVGDETLYGKDYIIEPRDQAPLNSEKKENLATDDVYQSANDDNNSQVMINVWAWPAVTYMYSPGYAYWVSPWYWGYYPGWYSPWRPYGWYAYHHGWMGYNYGFYGYRRYHYAYPHVHNYYYGRRVSSGYVQKNAPNYGRRREASYNNGQRAGQPRSNGPRDQNRSRVNTGGRSRTSNEGINNGRTQNERANSGRTQNERTNSGRSQNERANSGGGQRANPSEGRSSQRSGGQRSPQTNPAPRQPQNQGSQRINSAPRNNSGGGGQPSGGGGRSNSGGGGGGRSNSGGGGGGRR